MAAAQVGSAQMGSEMGQRQAPVPAGLLLIPLQAPPLALISAEGTTPCPPGKLGSVPAQNSINIPLKEELSSYKNKQNLQGSEIRKELKKRRHAG